jgi:hypothetical protein
MSPTKAPLSDLSPNTTSPSKTKSTDQKPNNENNDLFKKMPATAAFPIHNDHTTNYISPSDAMQSPTTKKLSQIKGRRLAVIGANKQLNHRDLFAKARAENDRKAATATANANAGFFEDTQTSEGLSSNNSSSSVASTQQSDLGSLDQIF